MENLVTSLHINLLNDISMQIKSSLQSHAEKSLKTERQKSVWQIHGHYVEWSTVGQHQGWRWSSDKQRRTRHLTPESPSSVHCGWQCRALGHQSRVPAPQCPLPCTQPRLTDTEIVGFVNSPVWPLHPTSIQCQCCYLKTRFSNNNLSLCKVYRGTDVGKEVFIKVTYFVPLLRDQH